jgi:hypothetical protein
MSSRYVFRLHYIRDVSLIQQQRREWQLRSYFRDSLDPGGSQWVHAPTFFGIRQEVTHKVRTKTNKKRKQSRQHVASKHHQTTR